tara:strand:+ start:2597 stop:3289 length:693 start_codon:yes stop_codon:yes gene_type:complete
MTVQEMHYAVDQGLQKVASSVYDYFLPEEVDFWLNRAQERFIKQRLYKQTDPKRVGFEGNIKRMDDLRMLITVDYEDGVVPSSTVDFVNFDLPIDYMFLVNARVQFHVNHCGEQVDTADPLVVRDLRIVEQDKVYQHQQNPFGKTRAEAPVATIFDDDVRVFQEKEKFILKTLRLDYLRVPVDITLLTSVDCELAEHTHHEIVDLTVKSIIEAIESPRYQTTSIEQQQSE